MEERLAASRTGAMTAYRGDRSLHSAYDPIAEAERFVSTLDVRSGSRVLVLVEPCLGYLTQALRRRFPALRIVAVHCSSFFAADVLAEAADAEWDPSARQDCESFLEDSIAEGDAAATQVIEWRPAMAAYGTAALDAVRTISSFLKRAAASDRTVQAFGRRWLRNAIRNSARADAAAVLVPGDAPLIVAGAGPGIEDRIDDIRAARRAFPCSLVAVSSAVGALLSRGIVPDLAVTSDGGAWAAFHLFETVRGRIPVAASLVSQLPAAGVHPVLTVADGSRWQRVLLSAIPRPFIVAPQRGTVTATAIDLAFAATSGRIYVSGMDLANRDIRTHARPYALDRFREDKSSRFAPEYGAAYERSRAASESRTLDVYASWFASRDDRYTDRLAYLGPPHPTLTRLRRSERIAAGGGRAFSVGVDPSGDRRSEPRARYRLAVGALLRALDEERDAGPLQRELESLLTVRCGAAGTVEKRALRAAVVDAIGDLAR